MMTMQEVQEVVTDPQYANRTHILVNESGDDFVTVWEGQEFRNGNIFGLDSMLSDAGCPGPRNLYCVPVGSELVGV